MSCARLVFAHGKLDGLDVWVGFDYDPCNYEVLQVRGIEFAMQGKSVPLNARLDAYAVLSSGHVVLALTVDLGTTYVPLALEISNGNEITSIRIPPGIIKYIKSLLAR